MSYWTQRLLAVFLGLLLSVLPIDVRRAAPVLQDGPNAVQKEEKRESRAPARPDRNGRRLCVEVSLRPSGPDVRIRTLNAGARVNRTRSVGTVALCLGESRSRARSPGGRPGRTSRGD